MKCKVCDVELPRELEYIEKYGEFCSSACAQRYDTAGGNLHRLRTTEIVKGYKITWIRQGDQMRVIDIEPADKETT